MRRSLKETTIADRLLLLFLVVSSAAGVFIAREAMPGSDTVVVEINGKPVFSAALAEERIVRLESAIGPVEIEIHGGRARVKEAHCRNQLCVKQGWVSRGVIVCLPGKVVVYVGGGPGRNKDIDAVTG